MTEWEKAKAGVLYDACNEEMERVRKFSQELNYDYNLLRPGQTKERDEMIRKYFKRTGERSHGEGQNLKYLLNQKNSAAVRKLKISREKKRKQKLFSIIQL